MGERYSVRIGVCYEEICDKKWLLQKCNSHFYITEYPLFYFKNAVRNFYGHIRLSDDCIEDELCFIARYLFHTGR